ncbi:sodium/potassium-transporting ATPase subunit beta-1-interacting protein isoform X1 [Pogonomyrmex barbatus]|uniref:Sodium/potassium-transporting ATPase subunit beta-1-interacting protein n=1 Tax=Pogonomyrmex barbatus TaxID=144034 RepID=A0A6I9VZS1_9HYME|nr:sodium/potassium-transporting ATPase subunit beta-1-interacting protein isoform X1 [Pogonomyrmex barbatus]
MGICSRRHFLLTICSLQLITTIERQVFDFLGFMWAPILVNFFNIIFVILGFFGAFQYRPKYIISYCIWNTLWLGWNIFIICFYLNVGILNKNSDILNLGTGSFSWWYVNGPGCKAVYDVTEPELFRPARPTNVTDCVLSYEVIEILHAATQCVLGFMAIVGGICLSKVFLEEDDSFDFVGGDDFGLASHTPLHPMYVSYSALPPPAYSLKNSAQNNCPAGTGSSHQSAYRESSFPKRSGEKLLGGSGARGKNNAIGLRGDTVRSNASRSSSRDFQSVDYTIDYLNPVDHLQRPVSPVYDDEYDSLDSAAKLRYQKNRLYYPHSAKYSPVARIKCRQVAASRQQQARNPVKSRVFIDHVRDQPLRSFHSDPRLAIDQTPNEHDMSSSQSKRDSRPLSLHASNF